MLKPKFEIGQKVFAVTNTYDSEEVHVECDVCNSTGKVKINGRNEEYDCPICHGEIVEKHHGFKYIIAYCNATIGKVQTEEYAKRYRSYQSHITYMLQETGVGSGSIWREERLFATEEEAIDFCNKYVPSDDYDTEAILKDN